MTKKDLELWKEFKEERNKEMISAMEIEKEICKKNYSELKEELDKASSRLERFYISTAIGELSTILYKISDRMSNRPTMEEFMDWLSKRSIKHSKDSQNATETI